MEARNKITFVQEFPDDSSQRELDRRANGLKEIQETFDKKGDDYFYKDVPSVVAFSESDKELHTNLDNEDVANAMTLLAQGKGWRYYIAEGTDTFYKAALKKTEELTEQSDALRERENVEAVKYSDIAPSAIEDKGVQTIEKSKLPETDVNKNVTANVIEGESVETSTTEAETLRKRALAASVKNQYRVSGKDYFFKDQGGKVDEIAFQDKGNKLTTSLNSERVSKSLVEMADSKGWGDIKVSGHKEFKRQVFRAASERGISVRGYTPDADDLEFVESKQQRNTIQPTVKREASREAVVGESNSQLTNTPDNNSGTLVAHGTAPYQNKKDNSDSYFLTIESNGSESTKWGLGLESAIDKSGVIVGDKVRVEKVDDRYKVSGERNLWKVENAERAEVITAVATAVAAEKVGNTQDRQRVVAAVRTRIEASKNELPNVKMYDNDAAKTTAVETTNNRQKTPELTR